MDYALSVDDLRLVLAVDRHGSLGAAARELRVSQPSASQRLARLERRTGVQLFDRDTLGARPTVAGREMVRQADHILGHLEGVQDAVRAAGADRLVRVGSFDSIASALFPVLDELLGGALEQRVDHGDRLVEWVGEGSMDGAFICIADQLTLPRGVQVHPVGEDELVLVLQPGMRRGRSARQPLRDLDLPFTTYDLGAAEVRDRLADLGARPRRGATAGTVLAMARRLGQAAVLPRSVATTALAPGERVVDLPFRRLLRLSLVTGPEADPRLLATLPRVAAELGMRRARSRRTADA